MGCQELGFGCQKVVSGFEFSFHNASIKKKNKFFFNSIFSHKFTETLKDNDFKQE
jgi:hypothetical protein